MDIEIIRLKIRNNIFLPLTKSIRRIKLKNKNFTIISNNCWGGTIYESYGIVKKSPTIGMFIMPEDYLIFIANLEYYLTLPLEFIKPAQSKWKRQLESKDNWGTYVIGKIGNVELHMLHYHDEQSAKRKWESRITRVNKNCLIVKFNDQNGATIDHIKKFYELPLKNKLCFVSCKKYQINDNVIFIKQPIRYAGQGIKASREPFGKNKYIDITNYINKISETTNNNNGGKL